MDTRRIGSLEVSVIGLGTNNFGFFMEEDAVAPVVDAALEAGITFFDTADSYLESEARLAAALGSRRDEVVLATKFASPVDGGAGGAAPDYVRTAVERSLARLGTDRIDLYQLHRPDPDTPIADTLGALDELVRQGKVREIGCSNFSAAQLREAEAAAAGGARFVSVQNAVEPAPARGRGGRRARGRAARHRLPPLLPAGQRPAVGEVHAGASRHRPAPGWSTSASAAAAMLSDRNFDIVEAATAWAAERGHSVLELAIAWLAAKPVVASVIAGATKPEQVRANAAAGDLGPHPRRGGRGRRPGPARRLTGAGHVHRRGTPVRRVRAP